MASVADYTSSERQSYKIRFANRKIFFIAEDKIFFHYQK